MQIVLHNYHHNPAQNDASGGDCDAQLNMSGFRKLVSVDAGALKGEKEEVEFAHNFFKWRVETAENFKIK